MNTKVLRSVAAGLVLTSLGHSAIADTLGEHPAVIVARTWNTRGIDPNTFIVRHPTGPVWLDAPPWAAKDKATRNPTPRTAENASAAAK